MGVCAITISADIAPSALGWGRDSLYPSPVIARKRAVFALRAEFLFLSFPKEKETKKKGNLRAFALKNPPDCTELLRSIKNGVFVVAGITGRASSPFGREKLYEAGRKSRGDHRSRQRRALPRNTNSDGQNSISPYFCYVDIEF